MTPQQDYELYAAAALALEEEFYLRAIRGPIAKDPFSGAAGDPTHQPFDLQVAAADHAVVQGAQGFRIAIYNLVLFNGGDAIDVTLKNGTPSGATLLGPLSTLPAQVGLMLPRDDQPHFIMDPGKSFVVTLGANAGTTRITGYVKYRLLDRVA